MTVTEQPTTTQTREWVDWINRQPNITEALDVAERAGMLRLVTSWLIGAYDETLPW